MRGAPSFKYLKASDLVGLRPLMQFELYSDKSPSDAPLTLGKIYSKLGITDANAKNELITYLASDLNLQMSGIDDADTVTYHRRFGKTVSSHAKDAKDKLNAYKKNGLPDYMKLALERVQHDFSTTPATPLSLDQVFQASGIDGAGHCTEQAAVRNLVYKAMDPAGRDKIADLKEKLAGTYHEGKHDAKSLKPKHWFWKNKSMPQRAEDAFRAPYQRMEAGVNHAYWSEKHGQKHFNSLITKDLKAVDKAERKARQAEDEAKCWRDLYTQLFGSRSAGAPSTTTTTAPAPFVQTKSDYVKILEKLMPYWETKKADLSKFGEISTGLAPLTASMATYGPLLTAYLQHVAKDAGTGNVKAGPADDHTLPTHALLGYVDGTGQSLLRKAIIDMKTHAADPELKKLLAELAKDARASLSRIYADEKAILGMNANISKDPKSEEYIARLKDNVLWTAFKDNYVRNVPDADKPRYKQYADEVTELFKRIAKKEDEIISLIGLLSRDAPMTDAESDSLMNELANGDLSTVIYDFAAPADYDQLAAHLEGFETQLSDTVNAETGVADMNTNFAHASDVRAKTAQVAAKLRNPPAKLATWDINTNGILMGGANVTPKDVLSYLRIRDAYIDRDIRAVWALAMLRKKGKIDPI